MAKAAKPNPFTKFLADKIAEPPKAPPKKKGGK